MIPSAWFPYILIAHITFAISLFLPSFLLPFTMRTRTRDGEPVRLGHFLCGQEFKHQSINAPRNVQCTMTEKSKSEANVGCLFFNHAD